MDRTTLVGLLLGGMSLLGGHYLEGGSAGMILQATAFVIVLGGTAGAVCLSFTGPQLRQSWQSLPHIFRKPHDETPEQVARLVELAYRARRHGLLSVEGEVAKLPDPFMRRSLELVIDGFQPQQVREIMEMDLTQKEDHGLMPSRVFEAAGGYAPTIGILGAVLGLIQVMQHLTEPSRLGTGVAVAFVATIYGVASANLLFLPIAHKLKLHHEHEMLRREMVLEGVLALAQGEHPRLIAERLNGILSQDKGDDLKPSTPSGVRPPAVRPRTRSKPHASAPVRSH
ncbi:MAG: flagellar motor protein [Desulfobaccales bacterium]